MRREKMSEIKNCETCAGRTKWIDKKGIVKL